MKITKSQLRKTITESIRKVLKENLAKETQNPNTLENLTNYLNGNRGIAEMFINQASGYVDDAVRNGDLQDYGEDETYDFFWDVVAESDREDDAIHSLVDILRELNGKWGQRRDSYGFLAELMDEYYKNEYL